MRRRRIRRSGQRDRIEIILDAVGADRGDAIRNGHRLIRREAGGRELVQGTLQEYNFKKVTRGPNKGEIQATIEAQFYEH